MKFEIGALGALRTPSEISLEMFSNQMYWLRPEASQRSASAGFGVGRETSQFAVAGALVAINRTTNLLSMSRLQRPEIRSKRLRRLALMLLKPFLVRLKFVFGITC